MVEHRMAVEADLARDFQRLRLGLHALELDAVLGLDDVDALQSVEEVEMPPSAAKLAVGDGFEADLLLLLHDVADRVVLDGAKLIRADPSGLTRGARVLQRRRPQQASDLVGAKGRFCWAWRERFQEAFRARNA